MVETSSHEEHGVGNHNVSDQEPPITPHIKFILVFFQVNPFQGWGFVCEAQSGPALLQGRSNGMAEFVGPDCC